jgi:dephospho-CoA kinase
MAYAKAIALTGGIATGKSTVASLLRLNGLRTIDADEIAHRLLDEHSAKIAELFGSEYVQNGKVDRPQLGAFVFNAPDEKAKLEAFIHPLIRQAIEEESEKQDKLGFFYLIDIPLFFETSSYPIKHSVTVYTPKAIQLKRFMKRNKFSEEEALTRIGSQLDIEEKKKRSTWVIDNSQDLVHLQDECEKFVANLKELEVPA